MAETAVPQADVNLPPERSNPRSEKEFLEQRRRERREALVQERVPAPEPEKVEAEPAPEPEPSEEIEPVEEPTGDPERVTESEEVADDATQEELLSEESDDSEPSEEIEDFLSGTVTLSELAEGLEVDPEALAEHVQITVTANGETETVSLAELQKGYSREADYTRSKMALAEREREFEARSKQAMERHNASIQQLDSVAMLLAQEIDTGLSEAELEKLKQEDQYRWMAEKDTKERKMRAFNQAIAERKRLEDEKATQAQSDQAEYRTRQQGILKKRIPEMAKAEFVQTFENDVGDYLRSDAIGYTDQEVQDFFNGPWDHRSILVLRDAAKFRAQEKAKTKAKKKIKSLPKVKSRARQAQTERSDTKMRSAKERLRTEGSVDAAMDMLRERRRQRNASHGRSQ